MSKGHQVIAWTEFKDGRCEAAFISEITRWMRAPAVRLFSSIREARDWVEQEAAALGGVPIAWVDKPDAARKERRNGKGEIWPRHFDDAADGGRLARTL